MNVSLSYTLALAVGAAFTFTGRTSQGGDALAFEAAGLAAHPDLRALARPEATEPRAALLGLAEAQPAAGPRYAGGEVAGRCGSTLAGFVNVTRRDQTVRLFLNVLHAPPGEHAVRLHQTGDCSALDAASAGVVWTPHSDASGGDGASVAGLRFDQLGDLGNLTVDHGGRGLLSFSAPAWSLGNGNETDLIGRAVVIHDRPGESLGSDGPDKRIGCAVISSLAGPGARTAD